MSYVARHSNVHEQREFWQRALCPPLQAHVGTERLVARSETLLPQGGSHVSAMPCYRLGAGSQGDPFLCARRLDGAIVPPCQRTCVVGRPTTVGVVQGHFPALPEGLVAVLTRPSGSALWG